MLPAVAQGAIGIERRANDARTAALLGAIHDKTTGERLAAERAYLAALDGSCQTPIAGLATLVGDTLTLQGEILRPDGSEAIADSISGPVGDSSVLGSQLGTMLRERAGDGVFRLWLAGEIRSIRARDLSTSSDAIFTEGLEFLHDPVSAALLYSPRDAGDPPAYFLISRGHP